MSLVGNGDRKVETSGADAPLVRWSGFADQDSTSDDDRETRHRLAHSRSPSVRKSSAVSKRSSSPAQQRSRTLPNEIVVRDEPASDDSRNSDTEEDGSEAYAMPNAKFESDVEAQTLKDVEITKLAKSLKEQSEWTTVPDDPFTASHPELDPQSNSFKPRRWIKAMVQLTEVENKTPGRTAGIAFQNLNVHGYRAATDYQKDVGNVWLEAIGLVKNLLGLEKPRRTDILRHLEGVVHQGEMLVVLGPPGSGCSTFLKTIAGETHSLVVNEKSYLNYQGIPPKKMHRYFRGEAIYTAELDIHFPMLSVADTLTFAAHARAPKYIPGGVSKNTWANHMRDMMMATFGISHTRNSRVGNDFIRGISGGERKRVTIAEAALSGAPLQCWDNSTRGLDSANAIEFCKTVRTSADVLRCTACVAIYQAPEAAYREFDKVIVLYEGRQIYFGPTTAARAYFEGIGFKCPERATTADFLTSITSPQERVVNVDWVNQVPRTPDEFAAVWRNSMERAELIKELDTYNKTYPYEGEQYNKFVESRRAQQADRQRLKSPYTLSYPQQVQLCLWRGFQRLRGDPSLTWTQLFGNFVTALILGSVFFNMDDNVDTFFQRGAVLFFAVLVNAFGSALEILTLYDQRPIVEKHSRYALYHPSAEAFASMLTDMPYKIMNSIIFNLTLYFMAGLRRTPGAFFFFWFTSFLVTLTMSMFFRTVAATSRTHSQAMAPAALLILAIVIFTGFVVPTPYMLGWCRWINWLDPVAYGFESLMVNEFHNRNFTCTQFVPPYGSLAENQQVCNAIGALSGQRVVNGDNYINSAFQYYHAHKYRNIGIIFVIMLFLMFTYLIATELISAKKSKGEVLIFRIGHQPASLKEKTDDVEKADEHANGAELAKKEGYTDTTDIIWKQTAIFSWKNVCYDIKIKKEERRILDHVDGWVKPGTLTALMGVSGAGKTTLLDVLATRVTVGVITGDFWVDGRHRDSSFQRKTGYVQQQDLHLQITTVREALKFSALLRQPAHIPRKEKLDYVDEVIELLDMEEYADAVVGVPGEGLNVEQRKRLTIGVELAAKPELLLFLDEPTSGLDSQTSWAILYLLEKLKNSRQAILCTIHQPSAMLFQRFDRLLFLAGGGKTVYFGEIGSNSNALTSYFERNGAHKCPDDANPAEWMFEVIGAAPGSHTDIDWQEVWRNSTEYEEVHRKLDQLKTKRPQETQPIAIKEDEGSYREFAAPFGEQMWEVTTRVFSQYWRTPSYIYSKIALSLVSALFLGFVFFRSPLTQQGLQNQMLSIFMLLTIFGQFVQQIMPHFVTQRALYEARERPSKSYSWKAFILANIVVELPWNTLMAVIIFFCFYYPIGLYHNGEPTGAVSLRGAQFFLFTLQFLLFSSSFATMIIAGITDAEAGSNLANLLFSLCLIFCGVLQPPAGLPGFWIFMYRVSPFTYLVEGMLSTAVANQRVHCADNEYVSFDPPTDLTCLQYMQLYLSKAQTGYLRNPQAMDRCEFCTYNSTNVFLEHVSASYGNVWEGFRHLVGVYYIQRLRGYGDLLVG